MRRALSLAALLALAGCANAPVASPPPAPVVSASHNCVAATARLFWQPCAPDRLLRT